MRSGFFKAPAELRPNTRLVGKENTRASAVTIVFPDPQLKADSQLNHQVVDESQPTDLAMTTAVPAPLPPIIPVQHAEVDPVTWQKNFEQCLLLLRGPEDEKRRVF